MHELALMDSLVTTVGEHAEGSQVTTVRLRVGKLAAVAADALRFCFDVCAQGTCLEGAVLEILEADGHELRLVEVEVI